MSLLRSLFWLALFIFFTFCFIVLFEHGTHDFQSGFKTEAARVQKFVMEYMHKPADKADKSKK